MATYLELHDIRNHPDLVRKVHGAIAHVAYDILQPESPTTTARQTWAKEAIADPAGKAPGLMHYVLLDNASLTPTQLIGATDVAVKAAISEAVSKIVGPQS